MKIGDFDYNAGTGELFCHNKTSNRIRIGEKAGYVNTLGYVVIKRKILAHRFIWENVFGPIPDGFEIDHINHKRDDNRLDNLRMIPKPLNQKNMGGNKANRSGVVGVSYDNVRNKWIAKVSNVFLGRFDSFDAAVEARISAKLELGYHDNHA